MQIVTRLKKNKIKYRQILELWSKFDVGLSQPLSQATLVIIESQY